MIKILSVFFGAGFGAVLRYLTGLFAKYFGCVSCFATFAVNIIGSFIIGFILSYTILKSNFSPALKCFLTVGFCGGLTTFSTFSSECFEFLSNGKILEFVVYMIASVVVCICATGLGVYCAKIL